MKKIKKTFLYFFGAFLSFAFGQSSTFAQMIMPEYGMRYISEPTLWEKIVSVILSPIFIVIIFALALIVGIVIFIKRKRKNAKKNS